MNAASREWKGILCMIISGVFFSVMSVLIRYGDGIDSYKTAFFRFAVGMALLGTVAIMKKVPLRFVHSPLLLLRGLIGAVGVFLFFLSIKNIGIAKGTVIIFSFPVFATIGGIIFLKEKVNSTRWLIILITIFGLYLTSTGRTASWASFGTYEALAVLGAVLSGMTAVIVKKLRDTDSTAAIFFAQCAVGVWIMLIPANLIKLNADDINIAVPVGVLLIGIGLAAAAGQLFMTYAYGCLSASTGSLLSLLVPVFNILLGLFLFGEEITLINFFGIATVLGACALLLLQEKKLSPNPEKRI